MGYCTDPSRSVCAERHTADYHQLFRVEPRDLAGVSTSFGLILPL